MRLNARRPLMALLVAGAVLVPPAVADAADLQLPQQPSDLKPAPLPDEGHPSQLIADEAYRRDGQITNMPTCIEVAGDPAALVLWQKKEPDAAGSFLGVSVGEQVDQENTSGESTLLACEQIEPHGGAAWIATRMMVGWSTARSSSTSPADQWTRRLSRGCWRRRGSCRR